MTVIVGWIFPIISIVCGIVVFAAVIPFVRRVHGEDHRDH